MAIILFGGSITADGRRRAEVMEIFIDYDQDKPEHHPDGDKRTGLQYRIVSSSTMFRVSPTLHTFDPLDRHLPRTAIAVADADPVDLAEGEIAMWEGQAGWPIEGDLHDDKGAVLLMGAKTTIGTAVDSAAAAAIATTWINSVSTPPPKSIECHGTAADDLTCNVDFERARREPNNVLILCWENTERESGTNLSTAILTSRGPYMFTADGNNCHDAAVQVPDRPGLWILSEASVNSSADWETGIVDDWCLEGKMQRISAEAAATEFNYESAAALIEEVADRLTEETETAAATATAWLNSDQSWLYATTDASQWWTPPVLQDQAAATP